MEIYSSSLFDSASVRIRPTFVYLIDISAFGTTLVVHSSTSSYYDPEGVAATHAIK